MKSIVRIGFKTESNKICHIYIKNRSYVKKESILRLAYMLRLDHLYKQINTGT